MFRTKKILKKTFGTLQIFKRYKHYNADDKIWKEIATHIVNSDALYITCGAGMGVDSGLPDVKSI